MKKYPTPPRPEFDTAAPAPRANAGSSSASTPTRRTLLQAAGAGWLGTWGLALSGCGGGGEALPAADERRQPLGGIDGGGTGSVASVFISAAIDSTTPLVVNGVGLDTDGSLITDADGELLPEQALQPGMGCQVLARPATGSLGGAALLQAQTIRTGEQLTAPVASVDALQSSFVALGQRVEVSAATRYGEALAGQLADVQSGDELRVWGELDSAGGRIVATRIERVVAPSAYTVRGVLTALDRASGTLAVGSLPVAGGSPASMPADLAVGMVVRVRLATAGGALLSARNDALQVPARVQAEIEGRVTRVESATRFAVDGVDVNADGASGLPRSASLRAGQKVAVRGRWNGRSVLASSVKAEAVEPIEMQGRITSADSSARSFVLKGLTVTWSDSTTFEGGSARLLNAGRRVEVLALWSVDGTRLEASHIHVEA